MNSVDPTGLVEDGLKTTYTLNSEQTVGYMQELVKNYSFYSDISSNVTMTDFFISMGSIGKIATFGVLDLIAKDNADLSDTNIMGFVKLAFQYIEALDTTQMTTEDFAKNYSLELVHINYKELIDDDFSKLSLIRRGEYVPEDYKTTNLVIARYRNNETGEYLKNKDGYYLDIKLFEGRTNDGFFKDPCEIPGKNYLENNSEKVESEEL